MSNDRSMVRVGLADVTTSSNKDSINFPLFATWDRKCEFNSGLVGVRVYSDRRTFNINDVNSVFLEQVPSFGQFKYSQGRS